MGKKILVIDDDSLIRDLISGALEGEGFELAMAEDGRQGLDMVKEFEPDLVIADIVMPRQSGIEVVAALKRKKPDVKVISITGADMGDKKGLLKIAKGFGADAVLSKPLSRSSLLGAINEVLGGAAQRED